MSIHQPRSDAFPLFTRILLLTRGQVAYSGETSKCLDWFGTLGYQLPERTNPLDFLVDITSVDFRDEVAELESKEAVKRIVDRWRTNDEQALLVDVEKQDHLDLTVRVNASTFPGVSRPNILQQTSVLFSRAFKSMYRAHGEQAGYLAQAVVLGAVMGLSFFQLGTEPSDIQSLKILCFQFVPVFGYVTQTVWTYKWCEMLQVFSREQEDGLYTPLAWVLAEFLAWLPINVILPALFAVIIYFISSMRTDALAHNLGIFVIDTILVQLCFFSWSFVAASLMVSPTTP